MCFYLIYLSQLLDVGERRECNRKMKKKKKKKKIKCEKCVDAQRYDAQKVDNNSLEKKHDFTTNS